MEKAPELTRILIVDDESVNVELMQALLESEGYGTETAFSGPEALGRARREPPDLIVLDLMMPDMDGFEVCRHLRADGRTAHVPILMVTGLTSTQDKEQGLAAGADDYVTKPVQRADLMARTRALLRVSHLSKELDRTLAYLQELEATRHAAAPAAGAGGQGSGAGGWEGSELEDRKGPAQAERDNGATTTPAVVAAAGAAAPFVLVVDDDRFIRLLYTKLLEEAGYRVLAVADAKEAFAAAAHGVDVILLDIMMPEISGLEALARLRQIAPEVPILLVTAYQSVQNAIAALRGGAFDFVVKGMKNEMLLHAVARAVERRRLTHENRRLMEELRARLDAALTVPVAPAA